jgi:DNA-binding XRE family transcriptional regulator
MNLGYGMQKNVGKVIQKYRKASRPKTTQEQLADLVNYSRTQVADIERGHKSPCLGKQYP